MSVWGVLEHSDVLLGGGFALGLMRFFGISGRVGVKEDLQFVVCL